MNLFQNTTNLEEKQTSAHKETKQPLPPGRRDFTCVYGHLQSSEK